jgi:SpoVK/Ycf46/Vps4 family AAA+-type ATPase
VAFLYLSGASLYSPYVGEAERAVRELFALGRACAPAILFLDELEAIVGSRDAVVVGGGGEGVGLRVLSTYVGWSRSRDLWAAVARLGQLLWLSARLDACLARGGRWIETHADCRRHHGVRLLLATPGPW